MNQACIQAENRESLGSLAKQGANDGLSAKWHSDIFCYVNKSLLFLHLMNLFHPLQSVQESVVICLQQ